MMAVCTILAITFWKTSTWPFACGFSGVHSLCRIPLFLTYLLNSVEL